MESEENLNSGEILQELADLVTGDIENNPFEHVPKDQIIKALDLLDKHVVKWL